MPLRLWRCRALLLIGLLAACSSDRAPLRIENDTVIVENQTTREWRKVIITVNDHFRGGAPTLAPGGRLTAPLSGFRTAFGQGFDHTRQSVAKIELTATDAEGGAVALNWAGGKVQ